ncbi:MAG: Crp/Fnr family transcriptional regulator [Chitinophagales bacterium]
MNNISPIEELHQAIEAAGLLEKTLELKRNEYLCQAGHRNKQLYFVSSGTLRIFVTDNNEAEEHTIRFGYQGDVITALDTFFSNRPSVFYIQALKKTSLKTMPKDRFMAFLTLHPKYFALWQQLLENLIIQQIEREIDLLTTSPLERYQRVLARSPRLFQEIPNKYIASYLRMTPETLSRIKKY